MSDTSLSLFIKLINELFDDKMLSFSVFERDIGYISFAVEVRILTITGMSSVRSA